MDCRKALFSEPGAGHIREEDSRTHKRQRQQLNERSDGTEGQNRLQSDRSPMAINVSTINYPRSIGGQTTLTGVSSCPDQLDVASPGYQTSTRIACEEGIGGQGDITPTPKSAVNTSRGAGGASASSSGMFLPMATVSAIQAQVSPIVGEQHTHVSDTMHRYI